MNEFEKFVFENGQVACVFGGSLGDEGKGKATSLFHNVDFVAAPVGGANAGHTVIFNGNKIALHEFPGGSIIEGAQVYLGQGRVINIPGMEKEIKELEGIGCSMKGRIIIAGNAQIIFSSLQQKLDGAIEGIKSKSVGTTKKGIGPAYALKALRTGINFNILVSDFETAKEFARVNCELFKLLDYNELLAEITQNKQTLTDLIKAGYITIDDTNMFLNKSLKQGKKILIEASQSALLALDGGMYPYCTSSDTSLNGVLTALNIPEVNTGIVVMKAIKSKVGGGYFPTKFSEEIAHPYRELSGEFGATTGRPRDVGCFDAVEARYVLSRNKTSILFITKADMLNCIPDLRIGLKYISNSGREYISEIPAIAEEYENIQVEYSPVFNLEGNISGLKSKSELPESYKKYFDYLLKTLDFQGKLILGTGPEPSEYLVYN